MRHLRHRLSNRARLGASVCAAAAAACAILSPRDARAQLGAANVPLPNVLLLQDTSGSFELMIDGNTPETAGEGGTCVPGTGSNPNRWGVAVQALTGSIQPFYSCAAMDRSKPGFYNQYAISTGGGIMKPPYDANYMFPFHRPVSVDGSSGSPVNCMYTPYALPGAAGGGGVGTGPIGPTATSATDCNGTACTALDFPADAIGTYAFQTTGAFGGVGSCPGCAPPNAETYNIAGNACTFSQAPNGALDSAATLMRFGLMTFDNDPGPGIGNTYSVTSPVPANTTASAFDGQWSYFAGWNLGPGGYTGYPAGCSTPSFFEVGARNPAAPPWEGRLIGFPNQSADTTATSENNQLVQLAIASMRPYGATPIAGMLDDAEEYYWHDPGGPEKTDQFVQGGCRAQYIILLTDGQPNLDLGVTESFQTPPTPPFPAGSCLGGGHCPYQTPWATAAALYAGTDPVTGRSGHRVITYVIGFAVSQNIPAIPTPIAKCSQLAVSGSFATYCASAKPTDAQYPCCVLQEIAAAGQGGTGQAYFADTPGDLNAALGAVLGQIAKQLASETLPVYSPTVSYSTSVSGSTNTFLSSFNGAKVPWTGDIERQQILCQGSPLAPTPQPICAGSPVTACPNGDDFAQNVRQTTDVNRKFFAYKGPTTADPPGVDQGLTIRPYLAAPTDGMAPFGGGGGATELGLAPGTLTASFNHVALNTTGSSCEDPTTHVFLSQDDCAQVAMQFAMGQSTVSTGSASFNTTYATTTTRCPGGSGATCNPVGAIIHSTPAITVPPNALLRDDSYQAYATSLSPVVLSPPRNPTLFVATTDGLLHAFDTTPTTTTNNELWSFLPPAVFPNLLSNYPAASAIILDGAPVTKDVVWERDPGATTSTWTKAWHTMLVASLGAGGRGYYALDITDPRSGTNFTPVNNFSTFPAALTGPHFQWQLASMNPPGGPYNQNELFGTIGATPAITTVFADPVTAGASPKEIGVVILPGGSNGPPFPAAPCTREIIAAGTYTPAATYDGHDPNFPLRTQVRAWAKNCRGAGSAVPGRSVVVARIDTGDIIAVFARPPSSSPDYPSILAPGKLIPSPFDSPMTGTPVVYPADVGAIAQQVFVGDADGTMWRLDITDPNPANWRAQIFFDSYNSTADLYNLTDPNHLAYDSETIAITPIMTLDRQGNLTLQYATGDQQTYTANYTIPGQPTQLREEINFVYSLKVTNAGSGGAVQSATNWYIPFRYGERVTGPMVVFDNTFYFATFLPPNPAVGLVCNGGTPKLWGLDFTVPLSTCGAGPNEGQGPTGCGGNPRDFMPTGFLANPPDANGNPTVNVVIPGVTVAITPSCTNVAAPAFDSYTGGMHANTSGTTGGTYSLVAQVGGINTTTNATNTVTKQLAPPTAATIVDSWASLTE